MGSWQSGRLRHQRIQKCINSKLQFNNNEISKKKKARNGPFLKHTFNTIFVKEENKTYIFRKEF